MSVGVTEGKIVVGGTTVDVDGIDAAVGGEEVGVDKTSTVKVQAPGNSVVNTKPMISSNHLRCFIVFSLSALANGMESATYPPLLESVVGISIGNDYKTFAPGFLFPYRNGNA